MFASVAGFDFSLSKPACCLLIDSKLFFYSWPKLSPQYSPQLSILYRAAGVHVIDRQEPQFPERNASEVVRAELRRTFCQVKQITDTISPFLNKDTKIAFEGSSFGSVGDVALQLTTRRFRLIESLCKYASLDNVYSYSPISVKSVAQAAKKGMTKRDVIESFIRIGDDCELRDQLRADKEKFMKRGALNFKEHLDDIIDAYWVMKTYQVKEEGLIIPGAKPIKSKK